MATQAAGTMPLTGQVLSRYRIEELLGEGGMGLVYGALDLRLERPVALKFLREATLENGAGLERLRREARLASALNHPHICTIHDVELLGGRPFLVMERLEGVPLSQHLRKGPLPLGDLVALALQLADALSAAHAKDVIHRDVKPGNVFVTRDGRAKLLDFGIALAQRPVTGLTTSVRGLGTALLAEATGGGAIAGTLPYMAPEQARDGPVDARTDLFSFGAVLYEMATGRRAFDALSMDGVLEAVLVHTPLPPSRLRPDLPPGLDEVILKALQKCPIDRYQSAREIHAAIRQLRDGHAESSLGPSGGRSVASVSPGMESVAVMPVRALATDPEGEMLADGATDALIASLGRVRGLRVVSLTSIMGYKGTSRRLPDIARELAVDGVVEGCLLLSDGRARVTARLYRAERDCCVWSRVCAGDRRDVLALQERLARTLARRVRMASAPACR